MNYLYFFIILFSLNLPLMAQNWQGGSNANGGRDRGQMPDLEIKGKVVDEVSNAPLEFATVSVFSKRDSSLAGGGLTDATGSFTVKSKPGKLYAVVEYIGYQKLVIDPIPIDREKMKAGERVVQMGEIQISNEGVKLAEVEVRAEKSETQFSLDKRVFNVGKDLANRGGSAEDILNNVPSVTVDTEGEVSLRGSTGVRILVDGKPSSLASVENANSLRQIPSNMIEKIEVITNPSARYEAEGMAGIINIVLKKDKGNGFNGSFDVTVGLPEIYGLAANVNYRKGKINWFANYGLSYKRAPGGGTLYQEIYKNDSTEILEQEREMNRGGLSNSIRFGIDYFIKEKETLTGAFLYRISDEKNISTLTYKDYLNDLENLTATTLREEEEIEEESGLQYSLNYRKEFSSREHTLNLSAQYQDDLETESSDFYQTLQYTQTGISEILEQKANNSEGEKMWLFQADYVKPITKKHRYEFGLRSSLRNIGNDYKVETFDDDTWISDPNFSNEFIYDEQIHAAYVQYGNKFTDKLSFQLGLRAEYALISTKLLESNFLNERDTLNIFPSAFLNYEIQQGNAFQASYSRRVKRPNFWHLNPFFTFMDNRNFFSGNPNLNPEYTDSYELNYLRFFEKATFSTSLYYRHTKNVIERIRQVNAADGTSNTQPKNLSTRDDYGLEVTTSYKAIKWFRLNGDFNFFRSITDGSELANDLGIDDLRSDTYTWTARVSSNFNFWKSDLQLRFNYRAPRETTQGKRKSIQHLDIGWSKDFLASKNLTATISVKDLFNSRKRRYSTFGEDFFNEGEFQWRSRTASLTLSYRVNQKKQRKKRGGYDGGDGF